MALVLGLRRDKLGLEGQGVSALMAGGNHSSGGEMLSFY
jgi:hypothetical protein